MNHRLTNEDFLVFLYFWLSNHIKWRNCYEFRSHLPTETNIRPHHAHSQLNDNLLHEETSRSEK